MTRQPISAAIFNMKVKTDPKYNEYLSIRSAKPELVENDTLYVLLTHLTRQKLLFMYLNMASEAISGRPSWI